MRSGAGLTWIFEKDRGGVVLSLPGVARLLFPGATSAQDAGWGCLAVWDEDSWTYTPLWSFTHINLRDGARPVRPETEPNIEGSARGLSLKWRLPCGCDWAEEAGLSLTFHHGSLYFEAVLSFTIRDEAAISSLPELALISLRPLTGEGMRAQAGCPGREVVEPKHEIGLRRLYELGVAGEAGLDACLLADVRFLEGPDFTANGFVTAEPDGYRLHLGGGIAGLRAEAPYEYLAMRSLSGRWRPPSGRPCVMRWLIHLDRGTCRDLIRSRIPAEPWGTFVKANDVRDNPYLTWDDVVARSAETIAQLESFPHAAGLDGRDAGIAPYRIGYCSDFAQWFYHPQTYWPFILGAYLQGRPAEGGRLLDQLLERLWAYSRSKTEFRPVNAVGSVTQTAASSFHWGTGLLVLSQIWHATRDDRIAAILKGSIDPFLARLPEDNVPRMANLEDFSFNDQRRYGTNGLWAVGLVTLYRATGDERYLYKAMGLTLGANAQLGDWRRMGGIEDWEGLHPDGMAAAALADFLLYEEALARGSSTTGPPAAEWLEAGRDWAMAALSLVQVAEFNVNFANAFQPFGPGASNIGWCRGGEYPDSDGRCESSWETIATTNALLYATRYFDGAPLRSLLELAGVVRKTHLSYCMMGCDGSESAVSLLAHELHDNNTDILEPERWPLVTSYMTGAPNLEALIFSAARCDDGSIVCFDRAIYFGNPAEADLVVFNPQKAGRGINIRANPAGESWRTSIVIAPKGVRVLRFHRDLCSFR